MSDQKTLPESMRETLEELDKIRERVIAREPAFRVADEARIHHPSAIKQVWGELIIPCDVCIDFLVSSVDEMAGILRWFAGRGFRQHLHYKPHDVANQRCYTLGDEHVIRVYFAFTGERCRYVQIGERTEPVMELRCEGAES